MQFNKILGGLGEDIVQAWQEDPISKYIYVQFRSIPNSSQHTFTYTGTQVSTGACNVRDHTAQFINASEVVIYAKPDM